MRKLVLAMVLSSGVAWAGKGTAPKAAPAPQKAAAGGLCLSDGQTLNGVQMGERDAHHTVRIGDANVRVPDVSVAKDCSQLHFARQLQPEKLRTITLSDGQKLFGTPMPSAGDFTLSLLDAHKIFLPQDAVTSVGPLDRDAPGLQAIRKQENQGRWRKRLGTAGTVGLSMLGAAVIAGGTVGVVELVHQHNATNP